MSTGMPPTHHIAIAIGGSGARSAEALIYLCAAGLGPEHLTLAFVDADVSNDSLSRAVETAKLYESLQPTASNSSASAPFRTRLSLASPAIWSPFAESTLNPALQEYFDYATMSGDPERESAARLMDALYTRGQRRAGLRIGFRGKPSIGAAVFADALTPKKEPWNTLLGAMQTAAGQNQQVRVLALGSIFGGTGAAGIPNIPRVLKSAVSTGADSVCLGGVLLLPYFSFTVPNTLTDQVYASPELFILNSKEALRHYEELANEFNRLYVIGAEEMPTQPAFALGGEDQKNFPHYVELFAGLAGVDFFEASDSRRHEVVTAAVQDSKSLGWADVPGGAEAQKRLGQMARMCFVYLNTISPALSALKDGARRRIPWYQQLFAARGLDIRGMSDHLDRLGQFSSRYLTWLRDLQANSGQARISLVNTASLLRDGDGKLKLDEKQYDGDLLLEGGGTRKDTFDTWGRLCTEFPTKSLDPIYSFQSALFRAAAAGENH